MGMVSKIVPADAIAPPPILAFREALKVCLLAFLLYRVPVTAFGESGSAADKKGQGDQADEVPDGETFHFAILPQPQAEIYCAL